MESSISLALRIKHAMKRLLQQRRALKLEMEN
jgi:hypothetical protein